MNSRRRLVILAGSIIPAFLVALPLLVGARTAPEALPARLTDQEFWKLVTDSSEPDGTFRSDNLLSNEVWLQYVIPDLVKTATPGRVYMGVGPEQNFTYMVALKPTMAFIVDIRRGNLDLQLMYKALFEMSADRAEFVSLLFSKKRPEGLTAASTAGDIFGVLSEVPASESRFKDNLQAISDLLTKKHGFALSDSDLRGIEYIYNAFYLYGPKRQYSSTGSFGGTFQPTYADLMTATDGSGVARSYLANEENFQFMKDLETRNESLEAQVGSPGCRARLVRRRVSTRRRGVRHHRSSGQGDRDDGPGHAQQYSLA
jgi:hypothetical protein